MTSSEPFTIRLASLAEKPIIEAMFQPYCAELARFPDDHPIARDAEGNYFSPYFDRYWQEDVRFPYLLLAGDEVAGFALVRRNGTRWEMSEFYVKPALRHRGLGLTCAKLLVANHPGAWHIMFNRANQAGRALWPSLAEERSGGRYERRTVDSYHECVEFTAGNTIEDVS